MTAFWVISLIVLLFPTVLVILAYKKQTIRYNIPHILLMFVISTLWFLYNYRELTCVTKECIEWQVGANGGVLVVQQYFSIVILFLVIPWFVVILKNTNKKHANTN